MGLEIAVEMSELSGALDALRKLNPARDEATKFNHAYSVSDAAKKLHAAIWEKRPSKTEISILVLPLIEDACNALKNLYPEDEEGFYDLMESRERNIQRYLEGKPSDFLSDFIGIAAA